MTVYTSFTPGYDAERSDIIRLPATSIVDMKFAKIYPHEIFSDEITVWVDGNIYLTPDNLAAIERELQAADIVVMTHPHRNCVYDEAMFCLEHGIGEPDELTDQMRWYDVKKYPGNAGLYGCGVIARRHTAQINELCEKWFAQVVTFSKRDQISFPYVFQGVKIGTIPFESVEIRPHL